MKKDRYYYPAVFSYVPGEEVSVVFPDFDAATCGANDAEAFDSARELLGCVIFGLEQDGEALPAATCLNDLSLAENERAVLIDVFMPAVRMAQNNRSVNRTVTLPAWLNAKALENNLNFSQLLQDAIKQQLSI